MKVPIALGGFSRPREIVRLSCSDEMQAFAKPGHFRAIFTTSVGGTAVALTIILRHTKY